MGFKIKDEVFFMEDNLPKKGIISSIVKTQGTVELKFKTIKAGEDNVEKITYGFGAYDFIDSDKVFATKEELKESVFKEYE